MTLPLDFPPLESRCSFYLPLHLTRVLVKEDDSINDPMAKAYDEIFVQLYKSNIPTSRISLQLLSAASLHSNLSQRN